MSSKILGGSSLVHATALYLVAVAAISLSLLSHSATAEVDCLEVELKVTSCFPYIKDGGRPSSSGCNGVSSLKNEVKSKSDMRATCKCLKDLMPKNLSKEEAEHAKDLPERCHVHIPYPISLKTDCDKIK